MATLLLDTKYIKQPQLTFIAVPAKLVVPAFMSRPRKGFLKTILSVWLLKPEKRNGGLWCSPANFTWNKRWEYNTYTNILFSASFSCSLSFSDYANYTEASKEGRPFQRTSFHIAFTCRNSSTVLNCSLRSKLRASSSASCSAVSHLEMPG